MTWSSLSLLRRTSQPTSLNRSSCRRLLWSCLMVGALVPLASCSPVDHELELLSNRQKWEAAGVSSYELEMQQWCFCPDFITRPIRLVVTNSETSLVYADDGSNVAQQALETPLIGPVPKMFEGIEFVIRNEPDDLEVIYSEDYGFPVSIVVDPISSAIDDEFGFFVSNFRVTDGS